MVTVSVIVPVYNKRDYLQRSIDSILAQDLPDKEVILVDDASTDGSGALCEELYGMHPDVRIFHQAENGGAGPARNAGLREACGQYIAFVDADDVVHPGYLRYLYDAALRYDVDVVAESGTLVDHPTVFPDTFAEKSKMIWDGIYRTSACFKAYRTNFLRMHGIEFRPMTFFEDVMFSLEAFLFAGGVLLPGMHYQTIETPESITRGDLLAKCPAYMESILAACTYLEKDIAELPDAQGELEAREGLFLFLMRLSVEVHFREAVKQHSMEDINAAIAPILQREFGAHAMYVQTLLDWCMCIKVPS